jgi:hypothetical protein
MTEKQLIELDFTRNDETAQSSGAPNDWHYYTYNVGSFCLISSASYEVENDEWFVDVFESPEIRFTNPTEVSILLTLLTSNYKENGRI